MTLKSSEAGKLSESRVFLGWLLLILFVLISRIYTYLLNSIKPANEILIQSVYEIFQIKLRIYTWLKIDVKKTLDFSLI